MSKVRRLTYMQLIDMIDQVSELELEDFNIASALDMGWIHLELGNWLLGRNLEEEITPEAWEWWRGFFIKRWKVIKDLPEYQYQHNPARLINQILIQIAAICEPHLRKSRFELLFPDLKSEVSEITFTRLSEADLAITDIVLSDSGAHFIEVKACLELSKENARLCHTQFLEENTPKLLSESEAIRVIEHSKCSRRLYRDIQELHQVRHDGASLGSCIYILIEGLQDGGAKNEGREFSAGESANLAILNFSEVYENLTEDERKELNVLRDDAHEFQYYWNILAWEQQKKLDSILGGKLLTDEERKKSLLEIHSNTQTCVELTAYGLRAILNNNKEKLYSMRLGSAGSSLQILELETRVKKSEALLIDNQRMIANGDPFISKWISGCNVEEYVKSSLANMDEDIFEAIIENVFEGDFLDIDQEQDRKSFIILLVMYTNNQQIEYLVENYFKELSQFLFHDWLENDDFKETYRGRKWSRIVFELCNNPDNYQYYLALIRIIEMARNVDFNYQDEKTGQTPLMAACLAGRIDCVRQLIEYHNVNLMILDFEGNTALGLASKNKHREITELLIRELNSDDLGSESLLVLGIRQKCVLTVKLLLKEYDEQRLDNERNSLGQNAWIIACLKGTHDILDALYFEYVEYERSDEILEIAFDIARENKNLYLLKFVLEKNPGKYLCRVDEEGNSLIMTFTSAGDLEAVQYLIENDSDVDYLNPGNSKKALNIMLERIFWIFCNKLISEKNSYPWYYTAPIQNEISLFNLLMAVSRAAHTRLEITNDLFFCGPVNVLRCLIKLINFDLIKLEINKFYSEFDGDWFTSALDKCFVHIMDDVQLMWIVNNFHEIIPSYFEEYAFKFEGDIMSEPNYEDWSLMLWMMAAGSGILPFPAESEELNRRNKLLLKYESTFQKNSFPNMCRIIFLKDNLDVNYQYSTYQCTPLMLACYRGNLRLVEMLCKVPSLVLDACDATGKTALMLAIPGGHLDIVSLLIRAGAKINPIDRDGNSAFTLACFYGQLGIIDALIKAGENVDEKRLIDALIDNDRKLLLALIKLRHKFNLNLDQIRHEGKSLLHMAVERLNGFALEQLLEGKMCINQCDDSQHTVLGLAALLGDVRIIKILLANRDLFINALDKLKYTPLMWAAHAGHADVVEMLLISGADPNLLNSHHESALGLALEYQKNAVVAVFMMHKLREYRLRRVASLARYTGSFWGCSSEDKLGAVQVLLDILGECKSKNISLADYLADESQLYRLRPYRRAFNQGELEKLYKWMLLTWQSVEHTHSLELA